MAAVVPPAAAAVVTPVVPPAPAVHFALTPASAIQGIIDFTMSEGRKLYLQAGRRTI